MGGTSRRSKAADPASAAAAIPAGLSPELLQLVMLVQSDLESRNVSLVGFQRVGTGTSVPLTDVDAQRAMSCLSNGAQGAASFGADLAHVRETARSSPPVTVASPDSRDAADVAVLLQFLVGLNLGCASCGGQRYTSLPTIVWYPARGTRDGRQSTVGGRHDQRGAVPSRLRAGDRLGGSIYAC